ncbi:MAG: ABC transporter ATP-binding protein [Clostridia bacterium]|nr:ABC transporter ATP-binding protein [Clostridia bacterium]
MRLLLRIAKEAKKYTGMLCIAVLSTLCLTGINLAVPKVLTAMTARVETGVTPEKLREILWLAGLLTALYLLRILFRFLSNYMAHKPAWNLVEDLRVKLYTHIQYSAMRFLKDRQTGDLMSRIVNDTELFERLFAHLIPEMITNGITLVGVTAIIFTINTRLALMTCIPIPLILGFGVFFARKIRPIFRETQQAVASLNARLQDNITGMQEIQAFCQEEGEIENVREAAKQFTFYNLLELKYSAFFHPTVEFLTAIGNIIIVAFGGVLAFYQQLSVSDIVAFLLYLSMFYAPITGLTNLLEQSQHALAGAERVLNILDTPVEIKDAPDAVELRNVRGEIEYDHVSFGYDNHPVLADISFHAQPGQMIALVGPTGVGKTTITQLLSRFYDPDEGSVKIDGKDVRGVKLSSLRGNIGMVMHDAFLFNGTVAENISYGKPDASREEIEQAAKKAHIHDDIMEMRNGYDTQVGERGTKLSGGQKQRIAIARAVLCRSPILVLDEATASVDVETEMEIQEAIAEIAGQCTIIAIAHRLSTVRRADTILVLEKGQIVQQGSHDQLLAEDGLYRRMCLAQEQGARISA